VGYCFADACWRRCRSDEREDRGLHAWQGVERDERRSAIWLLGSLASCESHDSVGGASVSGYDQRYSDLLLPLVHPDTA
jgi:hypothetical protein